MMNGILKYPKGAILPYKYLSSVTKEAPAIEITKSDTDTIITTEQAKSKLESYKALAKEWSLNLN